MSSVSSEDAERDTVRESRPVHSEAVPASKEGMLKRERIVDEPNTPEHLQGVSGYKVQVPIEYGSNSRKPFGPVGAIVYTVFLYFAAQFGVALALFGGLLAVGWGQKRAEQWLAESVTGQFWFILIAEVLTVGTMIWLLRRRQVSVAKIGWNKPAWRYLGTALLGFGVYFVGYVLVAAVVKQLIPALDFEQKQQIGFDTARTSEELMLTAISLVVLPPLAEELLFRGFLFSGLRNRFPFLPGAVVTSVLFGIGHLQFGSEVPLLWAAAIDTFVLSMVLCYLRERTGSLWPGIFIHALKNGLAFSVLFLFKLW